MMLIRRNLLNKEPNKEPNKESNDADTEEFADTYTNTRRSLLIQRSNITSISFITLILMVQPLWL